MPARTANVRYCTPFKVMGLRWWRRDYPGIAEGAQSRSGSRSPSSARLMTLLPTAAAAGVERSSILSAAQAASRGISVTIGHTSRAPEASDIRDVRQAVS
jgi:hypothetical protein